MEKKCSLCQKVKLISEFKKNKKSKGGRVNQCRACSREYARLNKDRSKIVRAMRNYNITEQEATELYTITTCGICGEAKEKMCIDHCHDTGKIRGILCNECNAGIGMLKDNAELLRRGVVWLEKD